MESEPDMKPPRKLGELREGAIGTVYQPGKEEPSFPPLVVLTESAYEDILTRLHRPEDFVLNGNKRTDTP